MNRVAKTGWRLWLPVGFGVVVIAAVAWLGVRQLQAQAELLSAQSLLREAKAQAFAMDIGGATQTLHLAEAATAHAVELTSDPVWRLGEFVPAVGGNLTAARKLASVSNLVVSKVAGPLLDAAAAIDPSALAPKNGTISTEPFVEAAPSIHLAKAGLDEAITAVGAIDTGQSISELVAARTALSGVLDQLSPVLSTLDGLMPLLAPGLGADVPRQYIVMFQNPAEARALGGTALSFGLLSVDKGQIRLESTTPASQGNFSEYASSVLPLADGEQQLFDGTLGTSISNATVTPSFSKAAEIVTEMWRLKTGVSVNGVVSIDPVALSYLLAATGPISLSTGEVLTSANLVATLLNQTYLKYDTGHARADNDSQDRVFAEAVAATFARLTAGAGLDAKKLISAGVQGWNEQRIQAWSADPAEESELIRLRNGGGEPPVSDAQTDRVGVYVQDNVGSKLTYYLRQNVSLGQASCRADGRQNYRVVVDLSNTLNPAEVATLPYAVTGEGPHEGLEKGQSRLIVMLYAPPGSTISGAAVNGDSVALPANHDGDYPVGKVVVTIDPGSAATLTYDVVAAAPGVRELSVFVTPLVTPTKITTAPLDCQAVDDGRADSGSAGQ